MISRQATSLSPVVLIRSLWNHRRLIVQLTWRDIAQRYRGSVLGLTWSLLTPLLMLAIYTFVFSTVFPSRWSSVAPSHGHFALLLFAGLCVHGFFAEVVNRAPALVLGNPGYVKRVVFPLEILPAVGVGAALFQLAVNLLVLTGAQAWIAGGLPLSALWLPVVIAPLILAVLGCAWFIASLGVYLRDIASILLPLTAALMFLSPVFYAQEAVPEPYRSWLGLNPLTFIIEQSRSVLIFGNGPDWDGWVVYALIALLVAWCGYAWFQLTRRGFADVL